jgi:parallel beta-helix repeat protein
MGIWLSSSKNIRIYNPIVTDCWGDGIYIGRADLKNPNDNILIHGANLDNNRRNGISITSGRNINIIDPVISNTHGTSPEAGIDIEPNNNEDVIDNIFIQNPHTINSGEYGMLLILDTMIGQAPKDVNIIIENHLDETSSIGFRVAGYRDKNEKNSKKITGNIEIKNSSWKFNKLPFKMESTEGMLPKIQFSNTKIYHKKDNKVILDSRFLESKMLEYQNGGVLFK